MIHRYFASSLGLLIVGLAILAWRNRHDPAQPVRVPLALVPLVLFQGLLGMWTVTLLLKPLVVTLHLIGGLTTLSLLTWQAMRVRHVTGVEPRSLRSLATVALSVLALQIFLGGWTSTNYAAVSCPDFPRCQASFWPQMDARDAFVLWRGLGIDYEGGVLAHPARVAIHFVHRLGAVTVALVLGFCVWQVTRRAQNAAVRHAARWMAVMLVGQLIVGPWMVLQGFPLWLATLHNAMAALLLISVVRLNRLLWSVPVAQS